MERGDVLKTIKKEVEEMVDGLCEMQTPQEMSIDIKIELGDLVLERSCLQPEHNVRRTDDWNWEGGNGNCSSGEDLSISKQHLSETVAGTKELQDDPLFLPENILFQSLQTKIQRGKEYKKEWRRKNMLEKPPTAEEKAKRNERDRKLRADMDPDQRADILRRRRERYIRMKKVTPVVEKNVAFSVEDALKLQKRAYERRRKQLWRMQRKNSKDDLS